MSSRIKQALADGLANYISQQIPALTGQVSAGWEDPEQVATFPSAAVLPERMQFMPFNEDEADDSDPNIVVISVGELEGTCTLRLYCKSRDERADIEDQVANLFFAEELTQRIVVDIGPITLNVVGSPMQTYTLDNVRATFLLSGDQTWNDEMVFSKKRYTFMTLDVQVECYIARAVPYIDQLILAIQADARLDLSSPAPTSTSDPSIETIDVPSE